MKLKHSSSSNTSTTVKLVPSTAINPFGTINFNISGEVFTLIHNESPSTSIETISPVPSTCPCTKCPPIRVEGFTALSKLTTEPFSSSINDVFLNVSGAKPTLNSNRSESNSVTVKHVPFTAMLSPRFTSSRTVGEWITMSYDSPDSSKPSSLTFPISSTIPLPPSKNSSPPFFPAVLHYKFNLSVTTKATDSPISTSEEPSATFSLPTPLSYVWVFRFLQLSFEDGRSWFETINQSATTLFGEHNPINFGSYHFPVLKWHKNQSMNWGVRESPQMSDARSIGSRSYDLICDLTYNAILVRSGNHDIDFYKSPLTMVCKPDLKDKILAKLQPRLAYLAIFKVLF
ncbi:hypothetical protein LXL04_009689 [Taraxacum kok-saghyz]